MVDSFYVKVPRKKYITIDWPFYICYVVFAMLGLFLLVRGITTSNEYNRFNYVGIIEGIAFIVVGIGIIVAHFYLRPAGSLLIEITTNGTLVLTSKNLPPQSIKPIKTETRKDGWIIIFGSWRNKVLLPPLDEDGKETAKRLEKVFWFD